VKSADVARTGRGWAVGQQPAVQAMERVVE